MQPLPTYKKSVSKQHSLQKLIRKVSLLRQQGQTTVFAWGMFDLLTARHIGYITKARALGDYLLVGVYTDAVVRRVYGKSRPIIPQKERLETLSAFAMVDGVILVTETTPIRLITKVTPDIIACQDNTYNSGIKEAVAHFNLQCVQIKQRKRQTTTDLIQQIQKSFSVNVLDKKQ